MPEMDGVIAAALPNTIRERLRAENLTDVPSASILTAQAQVDAYNDAAGTLTGYDCKKCHNRGSVARVDERGVMVVGECICMRARRALRALEKSGLSETLKAYSWAAWECEEPWQRRAAENAKAFAQTPDGWFMAFGRPGTGKTHLCTAICGDLLRGGREVRYQPWRELAQRAKAAVTESGYAELLLPLQTAEVLYVDDFLKTGQGKPPTAADMSVAFDLLNARYCKPKLITIVSSEWTPDDILDFDQAVGSRIIERAKGRMLDLSDKRNWRLR